MSHSELVLTIRRAPEGSPALGLGTFHVTHTVTLGRSPDGDVVIPETTVSRSHARIEKQGTEWWLVNISQGNGVFIDGEELPAGERVHLPNAPCLLQLGGVILKCSPSQGTVRVLEALRLPLTEATRLPTAAPFRITRDGDAAALHFAGKLVTMKPLAASVLACLAECPAQVVHEWDVLESVGRDAHIPQAVSEIRRSLRRLVDANLLDESDVRRWIAESSADEAEDALQQLSGAELMRRLVRSRRGHGYCLTVPADVFVVVQAG